MANITMSSNFLRNVGRLGAIYFSKKFVYDG